MKKKNILHQVSFILYGIELGNEQVLQRKKYLDSISHDTHF